MLNFESDYTEGAHPKILEKLIETNMEQLSGYGVDKYCHSAKEKIREACQCPDADIYFISGGTQANKTVISAVLSESEAAVAVNTGHINVHEGGAVELTGHKVLTIPHHNGKMDPKELNQFLKDFWADGNWNQMAIPGMVYISHPTEYGTLYTKSELEAISKTCKEYNIPLFLDGARLGYGLMSRDTDVTLPDIARLCDIFYIGGTKVGALCGEAVVFTKNNTPKYFITTIKQHGAMLAKGRLMGVQFDVLFTDNLYFEIAKNAIDTAMMVKDIVKKKGYPIFIDSPTNQQFVVVENDKMEELKSKVSFGFWEKYDDTHTVIRFATSWATTKEAVYELEKLL